MSNDWTYLTRSSGFVASVLIVLALGGGLLFSARATGRRRRPSWWLDLHNYLGGLAFAFTAFHVFASYRDDLSGIGLAQVFIPMFGEGWEWGITWGVFSTYVLAAVVFTSWPGKRLPRRTWLAVHLLSLPATFMVAAHAWMVGSDKHELWFQALVAVLAGFAAYAVLLRVFSILTRRRTKQERAGTLWLESARES
jgi:DMSO/TMAO reductase YedYZ heme-binding membrane subunit